MSEKFEPPLWARLVVVAAWIAAGISVAIFLGTVAGHL